jgi:hypothetical protein
VTPDEIMRVQMAAIIAQHDINSGKAPEPAFADREMILFCIVVSIANDSMTKAQMQSSARRGLESWIYLMSPEMRARLGL